MSRLTSYRTQLLSERRAAAFAKCVAGNARFAWVRLCHSARAKGAECWYVSFQPSNPDRQQALLEYQIRERIERAAEEHFEFFADGETAGLWYCLSHSGAIYETRLESCTCGDALYRMNPAGLPCKHSLALLTSLEDGEAQETAPTREERRQFDQAVFNALFGDKNDGWLR